MNIVVERSAQEAPALVRLLASEGHDVRIADLDTDPGEADVAYLDVWTPETAPRVAALRARGTRVTSSSQLVLEGAARAGAVTVGVTGTAGKSTTSAFLVQLLGAAKLRVLAAAGDGRGHLWVDGNVVEGLGGLSAGDLVVVELTSSHLAFMGSSPDVAVVTCFWPDHVELHGSLARYRAAKETIVRSQGPGAAVVVNADDQAVSFEELTPARRFPFSAKREVVDGAFVRAGEIVVRRSGEEAVLGVSPAEPSLRQAALAAGAAAVAAGAPVAALAQTLKGLTAPPHRRRELGRVSGAAVVDDGMAATPAKARASLAGFGDSSVVLIAGGRVDSEGGRAHASPEERALLEAACDEAARATRLAVLFGPAGSILDAALVARGVATRVVDDVDVALELALAAAPSVAAVLFAPFFPVAMEDRQRFAVWADSVCRQTPPAKPG